MDKTERFLFGNVFLGVAFGMILGASSVYFGSVPVVVVAAVIALVTVALAPSRREMEF